MRPLVIAACGLALLLVALPAAAQPAPAPADEELTPDERRALELYRRGDQSYDEGNYDAAIEAFEAAFALSRRPVLLFNIANAHERAGKLIEAKTALGRYRTVADAAQYATIDARIANLDARMKAATEAKVEVERSRRTAIEEARREAAAEATASCPAVPAPVPVPDAPAPEEHPLRPAAYALIGVGGTSLVAAAILGGLALSARSEARDLCNGDLCQDAAASALDRDRLLSISADVAVGIGAATVVGGALMLLLEDVGNDDPASPDVAFAAGPRPNGGGEGWLRVRF